MYDPADLHWAEQMQARARDIGKIVGTYHEGLIEQGVPKPEAWALAQRMEQRLWQGRIFEPDEAFREVRRLLSELRTDLTENDPPVDP